MLRKLIAALVAVAAIGMLAVPAAMAEPVELVKSFGSRGAANGQFEYPYGVAIDSSDNVYVSDIGNHRIQKFDAHGNHLETIGSHGSGLGEFDLPHGLAIDSQDNLYVADYGNARVQVLDPSGNVIDHFHQTGDENGSLGAVTDVAVDQSGFIYVATPFTARIHKFTPSGNWVWKMGTQAGTGNGEFDHPQGVTIGPDGYLYVADTDNHRIQKFSAAGTWQTTWGGPDSGDGPGQFASPFDVTFDPHGRVNVADAYNSRVQILDGAGKYVDQWGVAAGPGNLGRTGQAAWNHHGEVFVVDGDGHRVNKYCDPVYSQSECPPDDDDDGISNANDSCPGAAGPASNRGCPEGQSPPAEPQRPEIDRTAPESRIEQAPKRRTKKRIATFAFGASEENVQFLCGFDYDIPAPCGRTVTERFRPGRHRVSVMAIDAAGNFEPTATVYGWKVKRSK